MSTVNINTENNTVSIQDINQEISVTDNNKNTTVSIPQTNTNVIQVNTPGPQGPVGPPGTGGGGSSIDTGSFATTGSNTFIGNQTITGSIIFNSGSRITSTYYGNTYPGYIDIVAGAPDGFVELLSYNESSSLVVEDYGVYIAAHSSSLFNLWEFRNDGRLLAPRGIEAPSFTGSLFGTASFANTASFAPNYLLLSNTGSFATTSSFNSFTSSINNKTGSFVTTSSFNSFTSSINNKTGSFATTGSNIFIGNQTISGSVYINVGNDGTFQIIRGNTTITINTDGNFVLTDSSTGTSTIIASDEIIMNS